MSEKKPVTSKEAALFGRYLQEAMNRWLDETGRDEVPDELARLVLQTMDNSDDGSESA